MITWVLYLCIGIIIGGMAGFYFAKLDDFSKKQKLELEQKLQKSERELVDYKDQVTAHFIETANLINNMTESYQKVHEHLAHGSVQLCNNAVEVNKLTVSTEQLLPSTSSHHVKDVEQVTSLADSEAPKNSRSENNNNNSEDEIDSAIAESMTSDPTSDGELTTEALQGSQNRDGVDDIQDIAHLGNITKPAQDSSSDATQETMVATETMAVADDDEEPASKSKIPGSRMVH